MTTSSTRSRKTQFSGVNSASGQPTTRDTRAPILHWERPSAGSSTQRPIQPGLEQRGQAQPVINVAMRQFEGREQQYEDECRRLTVTDARELVAALDRRVPDRNGGTRLTQDTTAPGTVRAGAVPLSGISKWAARGSVYAVCPVSSWPLSLHRGPHDPFLQTPPKTPGLMLLRADSEVEFVSARNIFIARPARE